jgi:hypothetical protein
MVMAPRLVARRASPLGRDEGETRLGRNWLLLRVVIYVAAAPFIPVDQQITVIIMDDSGVAALFT